MEHRDRVFEIFKRFHSDRSADGSGIGLTHCRKIVEKHHGHIWVEDSPLGGAAFHFMLENVQDRSGEAARESTSLVLQTTGVGTA